MDNINIAAHNLNAAVSPVVRLARTTVAPGSKAIASHATRLLKTSAGKACAIGVAGALAGIFIALSIVHIDPHIRLSTKHGPIFVHTTRTESGRRLRVMEVGGVYQSATYLGKHWNELPFAYYRAFDRAFDAGMPMRRMLMLGGGGFAYPKHLLTTRPEVSLDVVEADQNVVSLALDHFYVDRLMETCGERLSISIDEGLPYLQTRGTTYDAIINDAFAGARPDDDLATVEAARLVHARLNPDGLYLVNAVAYPDDSQGYAYLESLVAMLRTVFAHVWVFPGSDGELSDEENYLVIASDGNYAYPDAIA